MSNPNDYSGSDSDRIEAAVASATKSTGRVVITRRAPDDESSRDYWVLDRAIRIPGDTTLVLDNCRVKLSDNCRDNLIRSANCGEGIADVSTLRNIHIVGLGSAVLEGATRPRATGDGAKPLSTDAVRVPGGPYPLTSYGTDAQAPGEKQTSDWRNIGVLLACVENFSLRNLTVKDSHSWAVSLERCAYGSVRDLTFCSDAGRIIDGAFRNFLNQDGLDLRQGCHDITIENITGHSGDDLLALTAIRIPGAAAGELTSHMVSGMESQDAGDNVHDIIIRNVCGYAGGHQLVRFLNTSGISMSRIILDGVIDAAPDGIMDRAAVVVGDGNPAWGGVTPLGDTSGFIIRNVQGGARHLVEIRGSLCDSIIDGLMNYNAETEPVTYTSGVENVRNVTITNAVTVSPVRRPAK